MIRNIIIQDAYTEVIKAADKTLANLGIYFCNSDPRKADVISVFVLPDGAQPGDGTKVVSKLYIPPCETFMFGSEKFILDPGESIGAQAEAGGRVAATVTFTDV